MTGGPTGGAWRDPRPGEPEPGGRGSDGSGGRTGASGTTVLLVLAFVLLVGAIPVGAAAVVTASPGLLVATFVLAFGAMGVLLACGLLAGARTVRAAHRRRLAEREAFVPPDEQIP